MTRLAAALGLVGLLGCATTRAYEHNRLDSNVQFITGWLEKNSSPTHCPFYVHQESEEVTPAPCSVPVACYFINRASTDDEAGMDFNYIKYGCSEKDTFVLRYFDLPGIVAPRWVAYHDVGLDGFLFPPPQGEFYVTQAFGTEFYEEALKHQQKLEQLHTAYVKGIEEVAAYLHQKQVQ